MTSGGGFYDVAESPHLRELKVTEMGFFGGKLKIGKSWKIQSFKGE